MADKICFTRKVLYYLGKGVKRDLLEAEMWYRLAAEQGHDNANKFLKYLEQQIGIVELDSNFVIRLIPD